MFGEISAVYIQSVRLDIMYVIRIRSICKETGGHLAVDRPQKDALSLQLLDDLRWKWFGFQSLDPDVDPYLHWRFALVQSIITSREFNQDVSRAKREADAGPVVITDRGEPAYVLLSYERYGALVGPRASLREALMQGGGDEIEFNPAALGPVNWRVPDLG